MQWHNITIGLQEANLQYIRAVESTLTARSSPEQLWAPRGTFIESMPEGIKAWTVSTNHVIVTWINSRNTNLLYVD